MTTAIPRHVWDGQITTLEYRKGQYAQGQALRPALCMTSSCQLFRNAPLHRITLQLSQLSYCTFTEACLLNGVYRIRSLY